MKIKEKDIKLLWGRSGNRCSICKIELSSDNKTSTKDYPLGEQAHIVAEEVDGPRGVSQLTLPERNSYSNLILLCPTHHTVIDKDPEFYPIEKLQLIKTEHELSVKEKLSNTVDLTNEVNNLIYASLVDIIVGCLDIDQWDAWSSQLLSTNHNMEYVRKQCIVDLQIKVSKVLWPGKYPELEESIKLLSKLFGNVLGKYLEHAEIKSGGDFSGIRFYKFFYDKGEPIVSKKVAEYNDWEEDLSITMHEATKSLNLFADMVRKYINPFFYITEGKFMLSEGPFEDLEYKFYIPEFIQKEK